MKRILLIFLMSLLLVSCGGVGDTQHGFLAVGTTGVTFIQFVENNGQLTGQLQGVDLMNGQAHSYNEALTGILANGQISLSVSWFGITLTLTGTYDGSTLILNYPDNNGHLIPTTFQPATVSDYNTSVDNFESNVQATAIAVQNAQATQDQQIAESQATAVAAQATAAYIADEQNRLNYDLANIGSAISSLTTDADFSSLLQQYQNDINQEQKDYQTEQSDAQAGCSNGNAGVVAGDDGVVNGDVGVIHGDDGVLQGDTNLLSTDIASVQDYVNKIAQHWHDLGHSSPGVSQNDINTALQHGNDALKQAQVNQQDAQNKAAQFDSAAKQILQQADNLYASMHC